MRRALPGRTWGTDMNEVQAQALAGDQSGLAQPIVRGFWINNGPLTMLPDLEGVDAQSYAEAVMAVVNEVMDLAEESRERVIELAQAQRDAFAAQCERADQELAAVSDIRSRRP